MLRCTRAFTLIELALVLVIVSLMTGFGLQAFEGTTGTNCFESTKVQLQTIDKALQNFAARERRLPKPARMDVGSTSPAFGYESSPTPVAGVLHGALPHAALNLPAQYAADCWGDKIAYAVTDAHTSSDDTTGYPSGTPGVIELRGGTVASSAPLSTAISYVALSHGQNRMGATPLAAGNSAVGIACNATMTDGRNCDGDAIFFNAMPNTGNTSNSFDDLLVFSARTQSTEDCAGQTVNWGTGNECSNSVAARTHGSAPLVVTNAVANWSGSVTVRCNDGVLEKSGATCIPTAPCSAATIAWANGSAPGGSCGGNTGGTITHGAPAVTVNNSNTNYTGTARVSCNNGTLTYPGPHTCNPTPPCGATTLSWGAGCSASVGTKNSGDPTATVSNSASWYNGSTNYTCTNGAYVLSSSSCVATPPSPCTTQSVSWSGSASGCSATVGGLAHNGSTSVSSTASGKSGTATATCYNGVTTASGNCFNDCPASSTSWGSNCSGPYGNLSHGAAGVVVSNTAGGYSGSVTLSCTNGVIGQGSPTCAATINGTCGSSNGGHYTTAPSTFLCMSGTASAVTGTGPYTWTCGGSGGGITANCSANRSCVGTTHNWSGNCSGNSLTIVSGAQSGVNNTASGYTGTLTLDCNQGVWTSSNPICDPVPPVVHGACGAAHNGSSLAAPSSALCTAGTPTSVTGSGPYSWSCTGSGGGTTANCSSNRSCAAASPYTWNTNCTANLSELAHTGSVTLNNGASGYTGTVTVGCSQGTLNNTSPTCTSTAPAGGNIYCWGLGSNGTVGDGTTNSRNVPTQATNPSGVTSWLSSWRGTISTVSCAVANTGNAYCWGGNYNGTIGDNTSGTGTNRLVPTLVINPSGVTSWSKVAVGRGHSCGIGNNGNAYCWGYNAYGQIGNNTIVNSPVPTLVTKPSGVTSWTDITTTNNHSCGIGNNGLAYCWGRNTSGQLGNNTTNNSLVPTLVTKPGAVTSWTQIAAGGLDINGLNYTCALANTGNAYCWGYNGASGGGFLGDGTLTTRLTPTLVTKPGAVGRWVVLAVGGQVSCAIGNNGLLYCWGWGGAGDGTNTERRVPTVVPNPSGVSTWHRFASGSNHLCGIANTGNAYCWGWNYEGALGMGTTDTNSYYTPLLVTNPSGVTGWSDISMGENYGCAISGTACILDNQSSGGNAAACCNGDSNSDGVCGP